MEEQQQHHYIQGHKDSGQRLDHAAARPTQGFVKSVENELGQGFEIDIL